VGDRRFRFKHRTLVAASVALIFSNAASWANPTAPQVVNGAVSFQQPAAGVLNVTNSPGSIIHWQGFSIGASEITRFIQQSASSAVLNRVTGGNVSQIYGQLLSNGRVFLVNPGGIVVGPGAIVDTAGFVGSTLHMLDSDFLAGRLKFQGDPSSGSIINQGWIRTGYGGHVVLVAPSIENSGLIHTPGGELILAAGQKVTVSSLDHEGVQFEVQAPSDSVLNVGKLIADGGAVGVFAGTLKHSGEIRANSLVYDEAGRVLLKAQNEIQLTAGSATVADGRSGGSISVQTSGGATRVAGDVSATGSSGAGGNIQLLGSRVAVVENSAVNASGATGGGRILVGGDYQGANPAVQNSSNTFVGSSATLRADATQSGDGGRIVVWSDDKAQFYGTLSAQGGPQGGNGGVAEVSGKQGLVFDGRANLGAPRGALGNLLLDPLDLYVFAGGGIISTIIDEATDFPSNAATVSPATLAAIAGNVTLQASRYMRIGDPVALTTAGQGLTATVNTYTAPALPDPLALSSVSNRLDLAAGITTVGGAVTLNAPTIQNVASPPTISIATSGGAINLNAASQIQGGSLSLNAGAGAVTATATAGSITLASLAGSAVTGTAQGSISTSGAITTTGGAVSLTATSGGIFTSGGVSSGGGNVTMAAGSSVQPGALAAGAGTVALTGSGISGGTVTTTGPVTLTANSSTISTTVNSASSLTATSPLGISINSTTNLNVANVTAGATSAASLTTTAGSILGTGTTPTVKAMDVSLFTSAATGGGIGTAATPINVDVSRNFTFRPNGNFNILLTGSGPIGLNAQFTPANTGTYSGTVSKSGSLTLNASADTSTVTVSSLNITSGFDQQVSFASPSIQISTTNGANLVATSVNVPTGDTQPTVVSVHTEAPLPVTLSSAGNLTLTNYTRAPGGLAKSTSLTASGSVTLGSVDASKDTVTVNAFGGGITVGSLVSTGSITLNAFGGPVNAQSDSVGVEVTSGGTLTISGQGIGTSAFTNPFDVAAATVSLTSSGLGVIGGANPVIANTQNLTVNAASGSTFNISTGATSLTALTVTANPFAVGDTGVAQVSTAGGAAVYVFDADSLGNFTFNPPVSTGRNVTFTSQIGDVTLGSTSLGTGNLVLTATNGGIFTGGNSISAAAVTLNAASDIDTSPVLGPPGNITASTGDIALHARSSVTTGTLNAPGQLTIDGNFSCFFCAPAISVGHTGGTTPPAGITMTGSTIGTASSVTGAGDITMSANSGALTLGGAVTAADGKTITLQSSGATPFQFTTINAGATGTVAIRSPLGILQTADGVGNGITAKTVSLSADSGPITNTADTANFRVDLLGTTNLTVDSGGAAARFDAHNSQFTDLTIIKRVLPATSLFEIANMGSGGTGGVQTLSIAAGADPFEVSLNSPTALNFRLTQTTATDVTLVGGGIVTSGGNVNLTSSGGISGGGSISSGAGNVVLTATGDVNVSGGITTTGAGAVTIVANNGDVTTGAITTGGGNISVTSPFCSTPPCNVAVSGSLNAGTGTIGLNTSNGSITGASAITAGTFSAATGNGEINLSGIITAPTVTLTAARTTTTANEGLVTAPSLATTTNLTLSGDLGFNVASNTGFSTLSVATKGSSTGAVSLTATGQTYSFSRPATDLFGANVSGSAFEVVSVTAPSATATFSATDGILLVRGAPGEPNKIDVQNLRLQAFNGGDIALQGNAANPLKLSNAVQSFSAGSLSTADILVRGKVTLSATGTQTFTALGNITVNADAGGGGTVAISAPTQTFQTSSAASKMEFLGGAASGEKVTVASTADQFVQTTSTSVDAFKLLGGSGADSSVTMTHSGGGVQTFNMGGGTLTVAGGSGANSFAKLEETGTSTQRICFLTTFSCNPIFSLNVLGGSGTGSLAQVTSAGAQDIRVSGSAVGTGTTVRGGTGDGANALIQAATTQTFSSQGRLLVQGQGGPGAVAKAEILSGGSQTFGSGFSFGVGTVTVQAGASNGSLARIAASGSQTLSASGTLTLIGQGTASAPLSNASAIIEGTSQTIFALGGITLNAGAGSASGSGTTSDAVLRNLGGSQNVNTSGTLILDGGQQFSTAGILNLGTGTQLVSSTGGIALRSDTDLANPKASAIVAIQNQPVTAQTINTSGPLKLTNSGGGTVGITTAGDQNLFAQYIEVLTNPTTEAGENSSKISSAGTQKIFTQNLSTTGFASLRVAALGSGDASVESLGSQLIELDYPSQMQATNRDGRLIIGDVNAAGTSRVRAGQPADLTSSANQSIFARAITIQAGGNNTVSELKATGAQVITTLQGGIDVLGGSGNDSLAQIDSTLQTILSNGAINVIGGSGINAVAQIVANTGTTLNGQTILTTNGDITLEGGSAAGAGAFITNQGSSSFVGAAGEIFLIPGTVAGADAIISVGSGPGVLTATCGGVDCTSSLPPAGASPTGGIVANSVGGTSSSTLLDTTSLTLPLQQTALDTLIVIAPEPTTEPGARRAPVCR